jgi:hypothetical protein
MRALFPVDDRALARRDRWLAALFLAAIVLLVVRASQKDGGVIVRNQEWGARFFERQDPYFDPGRGHRVHGPYPPSYALVTVPLALLPTWLARIAWACAQGAALWATYLLARRWTRESWPRLARHAPLVFAAALLLASRFIARDMAGGGGNLLYALAAVAAIDQSLRGRARRAGACFALSCVLKPNLAPLALFFAARRNWRTLAATALFALVLYCLPALWFGARGYVELTTRWFTDAARYESIEDLRSEESAIEGMPRSDTSMNQSLRAALDRLLVAPREGASDDVHLVELDPATVAWIARALGLALLACAFAAAARASPGASELAAALAFLPICLLVSPITWKAHHAALLPLFYVLVCCAFEPRRRNALIATLVAYYLACDLASEWVLGKGAKNTLQAWSIVTWGDIVLLALVLASSRRSARSLQRI